MKCIRKKKAYTFVELVTVLAIISVIMLIVIPNVRPASEFIRKNKLNTTNKILVSAIEYWSRDNATPVQKPANFMAKNSQGRNVLYYIGDKDIFKYTNYDCLYNNNKDEYYLQEDLGKDSYIDVKFEKGVLTLEYIASNISTTDTYKMEFSVYDKKNTTYEDLQRKNIIVEDEYKAVKE